MKIKKIHCFNMIEVLLALTVIAIGMTSIMGLFPVGLKASRQAVAENSSANVADQMVTYMRVMGESSAPAYTATFVTPATDLPIFSDLNISISGDITTIDFKGPTTVDVGDMLSTVSGNLAGNFLTAYKTDKVGFSNSTAVGGIVFQRVAPGWAIFTPKSSVLNLRRRVYFITQGPNCTEDGGNRNIDYSAMALVWKDTVRIQRDDPDGSGWGLWPEDTEFAATPYKYSGKINIELSWPLVLPYSQRKKRYYQVVINKP